MQELKLGYRTTNGSDHTLCTIYREGDGKAIARSVAPEFAKIICDAVNTRDEARIRRETIEGCGDVCLSLAEKCRAKGEDWLNAEAALYLANIKIRALAEDGGG